MHSNQDESHAQQVKVLESDDMPLIGDVGLVYINVGQKAEGEDDQSHVDPDSQEKNGQDSDDH